MEDSSGVTRRASRTRVITLTANVVTWDARVRKTARTLVEAGWDVTVIGQASAGGQSEDPVGSARVIVLPLRGVAEGWRSRHLLGFDGLEAVLDEVKPDVIHAHGVETLGPAVEAKRISAQAGRAVSVVYDALDHVEGVDRPDPSWRLAMLVEEEAHIGQVDGVVTVSEPLAALLAERYGLEELPAVVKNAPGRWRQQPREHAPSDVRADCGLPGDAALLVYSGAVAPARGLATLVASLTALPDVHLALQVLERHHFVRALEDQATALGLAERLHVLPYVASEAVSDYVSSASAGVIPLLHTPCHEVALCNKYLEFMHARLPVVVSDAKLQADLTRRIGNCEVFRAGDVATCVDAVAAVLAAPDDYRKAYEAPGLLEEHSWEAQAPALLRLYDRITGSPAAGTPRVRTSGWVRGAVVDRTAASPRHIAAAERPPALAIGPANMAGQGWAWATALERHSPEVRTHVYALERASPLQFHSTDLITQAQWALPAWHVETRRHILDTHTHVLFEGGLALTGQWSGDGFFTADAAAFVDAGLKVALVFHGSDIRNPRRHRQLHPDSLFADPQDEALTAALQRRCDAVAAQLDGFSGPIFVTTLDLLDFAPTARWLPVTVDTAEWQGCDVLRRARPVVLHAPSSDFMKGSAAVDVIAGEMHKRGLIDYRRPGVVPPHRMPVLIGDADIVLDQFALESYGVLAVEAMAAGRVVVGRVAAPVRARLQDQVPVVEAEARTLRQVLETLIEDREQARRIAAQGPEFVRLHHDGARAAGVLAEFVGIGQSAAARS
jgi:glycosyltransferase involved in cell wall biosynthesis